MAWTQQRAAGAPALTHPMDPRRGELLSAKFTAVLCCLLELPALTQPAIVELAITRECVFAATTNDRFFNTLIGDRAELIRNLRGWGRACEAEPALIEALIAKLQAHDLSATQGA